MVGDATALLAQQQAAHHFTHQFAVGPAFDAGHQCAHDFARVFGALRADFLDDGACFGLDLFARELFGQVLFEDF
jgi:hypothetical protein